MILLDTDTCIEILRGNQSVINKRIETGELVAISFMTVGELYYGAEKSTSSNKNRRLVAEFILSVNVINTDIQIMQKFGEIKAQLTLKSTPLADTDILIAATSLTLCKKLITGNIKHFEKIDDLVIENWIR
jgi:tRNA(fMet)-specific endonuclease VapC